MKSMSSVHTYHVCRSFLCIIIHHPSSLYMYIHIHVFKCEMRRKNERSKQTNKAKQHSTPKAVTFTKKNELLRVGLEPTTLYTLDRALLPTELPRQLSWLGTNLTSHSTPNELASFPGRFVGGGKTAWY